MFGFGRKKQADADAFQRSSLEYMDPLYNTALRFCGNDKDAEDLVQDTYLKALRFRDKFQDGTNLKAWLFKILTNTFINKYRRKVRERRVIDDGVDLVANPEEPSVRGYSRQDPEREYLQRVLGEDLQRALASISEDFRMAVILSDVEEFSYKEIAEMMDCPIGTVMSRIFRGRRLLQKQLLDYAAAHGHLPAEQNQEQRASSDAPFDLGAFRQRRSIG
jgi:RNA polymerase sigma-70 factor (ECF subfamily)